MPISILAGPSSIRRAIGPRAPATAAERSALLVLFLVLFFLVVIVIVVVVGSFLRNLDKELGFAIFALELIIVGNIEFTCASWAERDIGLHAV